MERLKLGIDFIVAAAIAIIAASILLFIGYQEEYIEAACVAIENKDNQTAHSYIDKIWDVDMTGKRKQTMLMVACESGNSEMIISLVSHGANVNKTINGYLSPLELFCKNGYMAGPDVLLSLLKSGAKQSAYVEKPAVYHLADSFYWMTAEEKKIATEETILLLQYGAPLGCAGTSILHLAAKGDMADLFYTIVHTTEGLNLLNMSDENGNTPLDIAIANGAVEVQQVMRDLEKEYNEDQGIEDEFVEMIPPGSTE